MLLLADVPADAGEEAGGTSANPENATLVAFAEVLTEGRSLDVAARSGLVRYIDERRSASTEDRELFRKTAILLDRLAASTFASLPISQRNDLVVRHHLAPSRDKRLPDDAIAHAVRTRVARDLIAAHYRSAAGWALVGYDTFPGRCGDLARYTRAET